MNPAPHHHHEVDWSSKDARPETEVTCSCGTRYRTHFVRSGSVRPSIFMRKPCPKCGKTRSYGPQPEDTP